MKKVLLLLALAVTFIACEGDQGPPGVTILGQSFEREVDFTPGNGYSVLVSIPASIEVFDSDRILVYRLEDVVPGADGGDVDVWSLLPQIFYTDQGEFQYNFNSTGGDVELFLDAPDILTLDTIDVGFVEDQVFRIVVLPVDFINALGTTDYNEIMATGNIKHIDVQM